MKKRQIVLPGLLLFAAAGSMAMSLGRYRGVALIGRPLDISVQAVLEAQEDPASLCAEADVFYADNKLSRSRVQVSAERTAAGNGDALIRIRSSVPVDEPVVSIYLRAGCLQKTERRYVVLADLASESGNAPLLAQAGVPAATPGAGASATGRASSLSSAAADGGTAGATARRARSRVRPQADGAPASAGNASAAAASAAQSPAATAQAGASRRTGSAAKAAAGAAQKQSARLKLEPIDLTIDRDPQLKSSAELLTTPTANAQERSAAAALWRALTARPEDLLRDAEKLQALETSVRGLQSETQKNRLAIAGMNGQIQEARSERYANGLVYVLGALLLLALLGLGYFARRAYTSRSGSSDELPWWRKNEPLEKGWASSASDAGTSSLPAEDQPFGKKPGKDKKAKTTVSGLDLDLDLGNNESSFTDVKHLSSLGPTDSVFPLARRDRPDFALSMTQPARAVKAEELFDVQQQADFFVSLGQHEQAIEVLRNHIEDNVQTSALVYLDLFNLYHQLKRKPDYEALRGDFNQRFNAKIPAFELYDDTGPGLEAYQVALTRIETLWPSPKVLEIIEESIFRRPDASAEAFDLEAYRELLLLYAVAREIISPEPDVASGSKFEMPDGPEHDEDKTSKFMATSIQPLSASVDDRRPAPDFPLSTLPPPSPRLGLDLDLSALDNEDSLPPAAESDADFFAQFAADIAVDPPASAKAQLASVPGALPDIDNLIDFDPFDAPAGGPGKLPKPKP
ncbi:MAG: hypothetical protein JWQ72_3703 [Polaromonas sp.]|nr:hypothetical protein [Polaromonas sp.]